MKRIISGIKPTGNPTLGNYIGAMRRWGQMSADQTREHFFFVPNLHALTVRSNPSELRELSRSAVAWLLACGVDPDEHNSHIFMQSHVPAHSELTWILNNYATVGELNRMTQFKDKAQRQGPEGQLVGLYDYPVMMAADILLYDADEVPVGDDQKQHVELTRDIATRFNNLYGATFQVPSSTVQQTGARIMDLQDPTKKMSKSDEDLSGCILLEDDEKAIERKIMRAVTDSGSQVASGDDKPALTNLLVIYSALSGQSISEVEEQYVGRGYGDFKADLARVVIDKLTSLQQRYRAARDDEQRIVDVLERGKAKATEIAAAKLATVQQKVGLI